MNNSSLFEKQFYQRNTEAFLLVFGGVLGLLGNWQICWVIQTRAELRFKSSLIVSYLALSDLLACGAFVVGGLFIWASELGLAPPPTVHTCFWISLLPRNVFLQSSLCLMLFVAVDRYVQLRCPLSYFHQPQKRYLRMVKGVTILTTLALPFVSYPLLNTDEDFRAKGTYCKTAFVLSGSYAKAYVPFGAVPSFAIIVLYFRSLKWLRRRLREHKERMIPDAVVEKTLVYQRSVRLVVVTYMLCWLNMVVGALARTFLNRMGLLTTGTDAFWQTLQVLLYVSNAVLNYPIYYVRSEAYRRAFRQLLRLDGDAQAESLRTAPPRDVGPR